MGVTTFPVATSMPVPLATQEVLPDPAAPGVTWYEDMAGNLIPGAGTYYDIVALNIDAIVTVADNIDTINNAVDAEANAANSATAAAGSATAAAGSAQAASNSATVAGNASTTAQNAATAASSSEASAATDAANALTSANNAATSATSAANSATAANTSATNANNYWQSFNEMWYGPYASPPTLDPFNNPPTPGDVYFDTTLNAVQVRGNSAWQNITTGVTSVAGKTGAVVLVHNDISDWNTVMALYATLGSPVFTGTPQAPTPVATDNSTAIATTAWVKTAIASGASITVSDTPPASPNPNQLWFDSTALNLFIYYNDGNSTQWVSATPDGAGILDSPSDGFSYSRSNGAWVSGGLVSAPISLPGNAASALQAVPLQQLQVAAAPAATNVGRNLIHNPLFNVQQRGAGPWTTNTYTADRWMLSISSPDTASVLAQATTDAIRTAIGDEAARNMLSNAFTGTATGADYLDQHIESVQRLSGKTVTVSFWAAASASLKIGLNMFQVFGTGGSPSGATACTAVVVTANPTWARYTATFTLPSAAGKTFGTTAGTDYTILRFYYSSGPGVDPNAGGIGVQSGTIQLWGVQLEIGTVATPLEKPDPQQDLAKCQRFYTTGQAYAGGYSAGNVSAVYTWVFPETMRATPTVTVTNNADTNLTSPTTVYFGGTAFAFVGATPATAVGWTINRVFTASADL